MWSLSVAILNPYEALRASHNQRKERKMKKVISIALDVLLLIMIWVGIFITGMFAYFLMTDGTALNQWGVLIWLIASAVLTERLLVAVVKWGY